MNAIRISIRDRVTGQVVTIPAPDRRDTAKINDLHAIIRNVSGVKLRER